MGDHNEVAHVVKELGPATVPGACILLLGDVFLVVCCGVYS